jgi:FKBP-type peptidyl-prolyl cis-trans isomerase
MRTLLAALVLSVVAIGCQSEDEKTKVNPDMIQGESTSDSQSKGELKITDLKEGSGAAAKTGDTVEVHYTGWLKSGKKFDSSLDRGQPFTFTLGQGRVIAGWDQGVVGMKAGGKRKLIIPSHLAYGPGGRPPVIPPNAELTFEVELVSIK